jgi:hypothetical protein
MHQENVDKEEEEIGKDSYNVREEQKNKENIYNLNLNTGNYRSDTENDQDYIHEDRYQYQHQVDQARNKEHDHDYNLKEYNEDLLEENDENYNNDENKNIENLENEIKDKVRTDSEQEDDDEEEYRPFYKKELNLEDKNKNTNYREFMRQNMNDNLEMDNMKQERM